MPHPAVRRVREPDVPQVLELVRELAQSERAPEFRLTGERLREALFGPHPVVYGHVAEVGGELVGTALWYLIFPTYQGVPGIYLEDLYVRPSQRGSGLGKALLAAVAEECVRRNLSQLHWSAVNWNTPAIGFYRSLGAVALDGQTRFGLTGGALRDLAGESTGSTGSAGGMGGIGN